MMRKQTASSSGSLFVRLLTGAQPYRNRLFNIFNNKQINNSGCCNFSTSYAQHTLQRSSLTLRRQYNNSSEYDDDDHDDSSSSSYGRSSNKQSRQSNQQYNKKRGAGESLYDKKRKPYREQTTGQQQRQQGRKQLRAEADADNHEAVETIIQAPARQASVSPYAQAALKIFDENFIEQFESLIADKSISQAINLLQRQCNLHAKELLRFTQSPQEDADQSDHHQQQQQVTIILPFIDMLMVAIKKIETVEYLVGYILPTLQLSPNSTILSGLVLKYARQMKTRSYYINEQVEAARASFRRQNSHKTSFKNYNNNKNNDNDNTASSITEETIEIDEKLIDKQMVIVDEYYHSAVKVAMQAMRENIGLTKLALSVLLKKLAEMGKLQDVRTVLQETVHFSDRYYTYKQEQQEAMKQQLDVDHHTNEEAEAEQDKHTSNNSNSTTAKTALSNQNILLNDIIIADLIENLGDHKYFSAAEEIFALAVDVYRVPRTFRSINSIIMWVYLSNDLKNAHAAEEIIAMAKHDGLVADYKTIVKLIDLIYAPEGNAEKMMKLLFDNFEVFEQRKSDTQGKHLNDTIKTIFGSMKKFKQFDELKYFVKTLTHTYKKPLPEAPELYANLISDLSKMGEMNHAEYWFSELQKYVKAKAEEHAKAQKLQQQQQQPEHPTTPSIIVTIMGTSYRNSLQALYEGYLLLQDFTKADAIKEELLKSQTAMKRLSNQSTGKTGDVESMAALVEDGEVQQPEGDEAFDIDKYNSGSRRRGGKATTDVRFLSVVSKTQHMRALLNAGREQEAMEAFQAMEDAQECDAFVYSELIKYWTQQADAVGINPNANVAAGHRKWTMSRDKVEAERKKIMDKAVALAMSKNIGVASYNQLIYYFNGKKQFADSFKVFKFMQHKVKFCKRTALFLLNSYKMHEQWARALAVVNYLEQTERKIILNNTNVQDLISEVRSAIGSKNIEPATE